MGWDDLAGLQALAEIYGDVAMNLLLAHYSALLSWLSFSLLPGGMNVVLSNCGFWSQTLTRPTAISEVVTYPTLKKPSIIPAYLTTRYL